MYRYLLSEVLIKNRISISLSGLWILELQCDVCEKLVERIEQRKPKVILGLKNDVLDCAKKSFTQKKILINVLLSDLWIERLLLVE